MEVQNYIEAEQKSIACTSTRIFEKIEEMCQNDKESDTV
jgi:hypothetical protein